MVGDEGVVDGVAGGGKVVDGNNLVARKDAGFFGRAAFDNFNYDDGVMEDLKGYAYALEIAL